MASGVIKQSGDWSASADVLGQFFYILLVLAIVILLFLLIARWFASMRYAGRGKNLRVMESCGVAPQSSVQIVRAGERIFLLGVTKDNISVLAEITDGIEESARQDCASPAGSGSERARFTRQAGLNAGEKPAAGLFEHWLKRYLPKAETDRNED